MAMACFLLFTRPPFPLLPERSVQCFLRRIALRTDLWARLPYLATASLLGSCSRSNTSPEENDRKPAIGGRYEKRSSLNVIAREQATCVVRWELEHRVSGSCVHRVAIRGKNLLVLPLGSYWPVKSERLQGTFARLRRKDVAVGDYGSVSFDCRWNLGTLGDLGARRSAGEAFLFRAWGFASMCFDWWIGAKNLNSQAACSRNPAASKASWARSGPCRPRMTNLTFVLGAGVSEYRTKASRALDSSAPRLNLEATDSFPARACASPGSFHFVAISAS